MSQFPLDPIGSGGEPIPVDAAPERPPANLDEIDWKQRALAAEAALEEARRDVATLTQKCETLEFNLASVVRAHAEAERQREIESSLAPHNPVDLDLCRTLIERELAGLTPRGGSSGEPGASEASESKPDIAALVAGLVASKPYLFRPEARGVRGSAMAPAASSSPTLEIDDALDTARTTGDRSHLLRYLRLRRGA